MEIEKPGPKFVTPFLSYLFENQTLIHYIIKTLVQIYSIVKVTMIVDVV